MRTILTTGPKLLIIILNRGNGIEFNVKINFYPEINLTNYMERKDLVDKKTNEVILKGVDYVYDPTQGIYYVQDEMYI